MVYFSRLAPPMSFTMARWAPVHQRLALDPVYQTDRLTDRHTQAGRHRQAGMQWMGPSAWQ